MTSNDSSSPSSSGSEPDHLVIEPIIEEQLVDVDDMLESYFWQSVYSPRDVLPAERSPSASQNPITREDIPYLSGDNLSLDTVVMGPSSSPDSLPVLLTKHPSLAPSCPPPDKNHKWVRGGTKKKCVSCMQTNANILLLPIIYI